MKLLDCLFSIIIFVIVICTIITVCVTVISHDSAPYTKVTVQVAKPVVQKDTLGRDVLIIEQSASTLDSLVCLLDKKSEEIDYKHELLLKARENESFLLEILAGIVAVIMGVLSFLGFRSMKEIEEQAEETAKQKAEESTTSILERLANSKIQDIAKEYYENTYKGALIDEIKRAVARAYIDNIEERLSSIEATKVQEDQSSEESVATDELPIEINVPNFTEKERGEIVKLTNQEQDESIHTADISEAE